MLKINGAINKVTMPDTKKKNSTPGFGGHVLTTNSEGKKVYKINLPNAPKGTEIELMPFYYDKQGNFIKAMTDPIKKQMPEGFKSINVDDTVLPLGKDLLLGYRFKINGHNYYDYTVFNDLNPESDQYNIAIPIDRPGLALPRQMVHIFPDSFNPTLMQTMSSKINQKGEEEIVLENVPDFDRRTPFNHLGGTIQGIRAKVPKLKEFGANGVISCPVGGQDNDSSHGYWTTNPYQITKNLGTINDFRALQVDLYKNGQHWINDGAYVNEGLQGIHLADIFNWGKESPFIYQFETKNIGDEKISLGIRPKSKEADEHVKIALFNAPYTVKFEKTENGFEDKGLVKSDFNSSMPTYVQIFRDDLVSEGLLNSTEPFNVYDKKLPKNKRTIFEKKDACPALYFRVSPTEVELNYRKYKNSGAKTAKEALTSWKNFEISQPNKDGGISLWVGNTDIAKRRFILPDSAFVDDKITPEIREKMVAGQYQVQDDTIQIGKFWTNEVHRALLEHTARSLNEKMSQPFNYKDAMISLIWDGKISNDLENQLKSAAFENAINDLTSEKILKNSIHEEIAKKKAEGKDYKTAVEELIWEEKIEFEESNKVYEKITDGDSYEKAVKEALESNKLPQDITDSINNLLNKEKTYKDAVKELIWENKIPQSASLIFEKDQNGISSLDNILAFDDNLERKYKLSTARMPENITDGMMSFPYESIEYSPDLVTLFTYPYFKNMAVTEEYVGKSRYEMYKDGDKYYSKMPEEYRELYKRADSIIANTMTKRAKEIMVILNSSDKFNGALLDENEELTQEGREIFAIIAPDIAKFLMISAISPNLAIEENDKFFNYPPDYLNLINMDYLNLQYDITPKATAERFLNMIEEGLNKIPEEKRAAFIKHIYKRINNIDSDALNIGKLILEKTESGLDWRIDASKDVGDWDAVEQNKMSPEICFEKVHNFWNKFNTGIEEYNPKSYRIGELTRDIMKDWGGQEWFVKEPVYITKSKFMTQSNYTYLYSTPTKAYHVYSEPGDEFGSKKTNMDDLVKEILYDNGKEGAFLFSGFLDNVNFSHLFVGNHDKPRVLHLLALDSIKFKDNKSGVMRDTLLNEGKIAEYDKLSLNSKAALREAVFNLADGYFTRNGRKIPYDGENFGALPFDINIDDVIEEAKNRCVEFRKYATNNPDDIKKLKVDAFKNIIMPALDVYKAIVFMYTVMPGNPTNYAGDEMGESGWETGSKNEKQNNRNRVHWERLQDKDYAWLKDKRREIADIYNIRNQKAASPLVNGSLIPLAPQTYNASENNRAAAFYRYNDKTDAICVLHNSGYGKRADLTDKTRYLDCISLEQHDPIHAGLPTGLPAGTEYYNALNPAERFVVDDSGRRVYKKGGGNICIGAYGIVLLRVNDFNGNNQLETKNISFKGQNPHVTLANMKYNI